MSFANVLVQHQVGLVVFVAVLLLIALSNVRALRPMEKYTTPERLPRVSILVPVRNEAAQIEDCVRSLLAQDYAGADFEVVALDDNSTDATGAILAELAGKDGRLTMLKGAPLPLGWLGKNWACHQLAQAARGELILFTDADTRHHPRALHDAVAVLTAERADLVTALPREQVVTWGEKLVVPFMSWSILALVPLGLAHRLQWAPLSAAIGQFMLFRKEMYERTGGHAGVRRSSVDDIALGRALIAHGGRWRLVDGRARVRCRMYTNWSHTLEGFGRHLYAVFENKPWLFVPAWLWMGIVFIEPALVLVACALGAALPPLSVQLCATAVALSILLWGIFSRRLGFPWYLELLYPICVFLVVLIALQSMWLGWRGRAMWKGRVLAAAR